MHDCANLPAPCCLSYFFSVEGVERIDPQVIQEGAANSCPSDELNREMMQILTEKKYEAARSMNTGSIMMQR